MKLNEATSSFEVFRAAWREVQLAGHRRWPRTWAAMEQGPPNSLNACTQQIVGKEGRPLSIKEAAKRYRSKEPELASYLDDAAIRWEQFFTSEEVVIELTDADQHDIARRFQRDFAEMVAHASTRRKLAKSGHDGGTAKGKNYKAKISEAEAAVRRRVEDNLARGSQPGLDRAREFAARELGLSLGWMKKHRIGSKKKPST